MAKGSGKTIAKTQQPQDKTTPEPRFEVEAVILSRFDSLQYSDEEEQTEENEAPYFEAIIAPTYTSEDDPDVRNVYYGHVTYRLGRGGSGTRTSVHMAAMYSYAFKTDTDAEKAQEVADLAASTTVWGHFMNLFSTTNSQMRTRLPNLPASPPKMRIGEMQELLEVFDDFTTRPSEEDAT